MNDFRTLQIHINSLITRREASPPDQHSYYLDGYVVLRQCAAESQAILATHYNPGNLGLQSGQVDETEVTKATLQRIILDAATRRLQAHKIYLRAAAAIRWVQMRGQLSRGEQSSQRRASGLRAIDHRLRQKDSLLAMCFPIPSKAVISITCRNGQKANRDAQELDDITDEHVVNDLRNADRRKGYWLDEDPVLDRMLAWIRMQR
ncbi:hypothetical protein LTR69_004391 [Exophiala sideris]|uniref:Uncharacterized protein n=1 Tax=Exophiala sideris TaxID=1016849 RepID=A0ABR0JGD8_9EURO|nr:hypothetical protein LTR69_004391 [Exophiala sideris]